MDNLNILNAQTHIRTRKTKINGEKIALKAVK